MAYQVKIAVQTPLKLGQSFSHLGLVWKLQAGLLMCKQTATIAGLPIVF